MNFKKHNEIHDSLVQQSIVLDPWSKQYLAADFECYCIGNRDNVRRAYFPDLCLPFRKHKSVDWRYNWYTTQNEDHVEDVL